MNFSIKVAIIIPSYNETTALPEMLRELSQETALTTAILIMDDSPLAISREIEAACQIEIKNSNIEFKFFNNTAKSGRGAAVRRGMEKAIASYPNVEYIIECDADGSHRPIDIINIVKCISDSDLLIGSRYIEGSRIQGWPFGRRVFSLLINKLIPRLLNLPYNDVTNGLRRYSVGAVKELLTKDQINLGFTYLSEQALILHRAGFKVEEIPILFVNRTSGKSTVTWREISSSLNGIVKLLFQTITSNR